MHHVALLRGINVGGKAKLPMKDLVAAFAAAGASEISTYIQSGNVIFAAADAGAVCTLVTSRIAAAFGYPGRIVLRSAGELRSCFEHNPFTGANVPPELLHVYFLAGEPAIEDVKALDADRSPGDSYIVRGREIYLHLPNGVARTKLTNVYFDTKLKTVSTARNWNTVGKLTAMLRPFEKT